MSGIGLIEVIVSLAILIIGLLGIAGMALQANNITRAAYWHTQAVVEINSMAERLRATPRSHWPKQITIWRRQIKKYLPSVKDTISCTSAQNSLCKLFLQWGYQQQYQLTLQVRL